LRQKHAVRRDSEFVVRHIERIAASACLFEFRAFGASCEEIAKRCANLREWLSMRVPVNFSQPWKPFVLDGIELLLYLASVLLLK